MLLPPFPLSLFVHFLQDRLPVLRLNLAGLLRFPPSREVGHDGSPFMRWLQFWFGLRAHPKTTAQLLHEFVDEDLSVVCELSEQGLVSGIDECNHVGEVT